ncbi:MAG: hypothetical protein V4687_16200 [Bacteroidota bacterium]
MKVGELKEGFPCVAIPQNKEYESIFNIKNGNVNNRMYLNQKRYEPHNGGIWVSETQFREASREEIEHFNACIAAGKYVDAPEKWVPKAGEWVYVESDYCNSSIKRGEVYRLLKWQSTDGVYAILDHCGEQSYLAPNIKTLRKALPHEIPKENKGIDSLIESLGESIQKGWNARYKVYEKEISNNLTPDKNEHSNYKGKTIEIRTIDRSISTGARRSGEAVQGRVIKVQIGTRH